MLTCLTQTVFLLAEPLQDTGSISNTGAQQYRTKGIRQHFQAFTWMGGLIGTAAILDKPSHQWAQKLFQKGGMDILDGTDFGHDGTLIDCLGRGEVNLGISGFFYIGGVLGGSQKMKRVGVIGAEATLAGGFAALAIKAIVGRKRPEYHNDNGSFHLFKGSNYNNGAFPSGHTTTVFALASVIAQEYKSPWVSLTTYGLASSVGFSRIYQNKHWVTDVVGGALLGIGVGKGLYRLEMKKKWAVELYTDGNNISIRKKF